MADEKKVQTLLAQYVEQEGISAVSPEAWHVERAIRFALESEESSRALDGIVREYDAYTQVQCPGCDSSVQTIWKPVAAPTVQEAAAQIAERFANEGGRFREVARMIRELPTAKVPADAMLIDRGALQMVLNALRRDAADGKVVRGEMADELEGSARSLSA